MYRVTVGTNYGGEHYDRTFDAPDWQTALIAAAEIVKTDQPEPPFDENHYRYHTPNDPLESCAWCIYLNWADRG